MISDEPRRKLEKAQPELSYILRRIPHQWLIVVTSLFVLTPVFGLGMILGAGERLTDQPVLLAAPLVAAIALGLGIAYPILVFPVLLAGLMAAPISIDATSIPLGFMRLYYTDLMVAWVYGYWLIAWLMGHNFWPTRAPFWPFFFWVLMGCLALVLGYGFYGNAFDRSFGDFRRTVVYLFTLVPVLSIYGRPRHFPYLLGALIAGAVIIILEGLWQAATGQFYSRRFTDAAHVLTKFELQFLLFGFFYGVLKLTGGTWKLRWFVLTFLGIVVTILGNFRSSWLSALGGLGFIFLYLPTRWKAVLIGYGLVLGLVSGGVLALMWNVPVGEGGSTLGEDLQMKMNFRMARYDPNVTWRFESYAQAMQLWSQRPWFGQGLGVEIEFSAPTSTGGAMLVRGHRVHNSLLWVLMSFGILGSVIFTAWITSLFWVFHQAGRDRELSPERRTVALATGAFLMSFLISTFFEIFLESGPTILVLVAVLAVGLASLSNEKQDEASVLSPVDQDEPENDYPPSRG